MQTTNEAAGQFERTQAAVARYDEIDARLENVNTQDELDAVLADRDAAAVSVGDAFALDTAGYNLPEVAKAYGKFYAGDPIFRRNIGAAS